MSKRSRYGKSRIAHKKKGPSPKPAQVAKSSEYGMTIWFIAITLILTLLVVFIAVNKDNDEHEHTESLTTTETTETIVTTEWTEPIIDDNIEPLLGTNVSFNNQLNKLIQKDEGITISFVNDKTIPQTAIDVSDQKNKSVYMWQDGTDIYVQAANKKDIVFSKSAHNMFNLIHGSIKAIYFTAVDTTNIEDMSFMFGDCKNLEKIDLSNFKTPNLKNIAGLFDGCESLVSVNISALNTSNVTSMHTLFRNCRSLETVDISSFDTQNTTNMAEMFAGCINLESVNVNGLNTEKVKDFSSMFTSCQSLTEIDVSSFAVDSATDLTYMFFDCFNLKKLNISGMTLHPQQSEMLEYMMPSSPIDEIIVNSSETSKVIKPLLTQAKKTNIIISK